MRTDFDYPNTELLGPVIFRPNFNRFEEVNGNQAWSLFFTVGQEDKILGATPELGRFFTNLLVAIGATGTLAACVIGLS